jgi:hypothetical protein
MRWVSDPTSSALLAEFACGGVSEHERDVEGALDELRDSDAGYEIRVAEARHTGDPIAVSVFDRRALGRDESFAKAVSLLLAAVNEPYRGWRMPDGVTRIGTFMLCDTLAQIEQLWGDPMPCVWGLVHRDNKACQRVLSTRHGFWRLRDISRDPSAPYYVHLRQEHLDWTHGFSPHMVDAVERASAD